MAPAKYRRSREQNKFICYAEAQPYIWRQPNIAEAESRTNLFVMPRREPYIWRQPNIAEAESNASLLVIAGGIGVKMRKYCYFCLRYG